MAPVRSMLGGRFSTAMRGVLALLCLAPQSGLALAAAPPAYAPQGPSEEQRALVACTPTGNFTNCTRFTYSGGDQTFTVPAGVTSVYARLWGGGGGGSPTAYYTGQFGGGGGGYTTGTIAVTPGQSLTITSGQAGLMNRTTAVYGGGGPGGRGGSSGGLATGASGGGMSAVWSDNYGGTPLLIAGGGGGSSPGADTGTPAAGGGGGTSGGQDNRPASSGRGGTQSAGGAAATQTSCGSPTAGSRFLGGSGAPNNNEGGGGGGGGLYGGGGGACQGQSSAELNGMGGGGSGYTGGTGVTSAQTTAGANSAANGKGGPAAGSSDPLYSSGIGNGGGTTDGGNGEVTLEWVTQTGLSIRKTASPTTYVPGQALTYTVVVSNAGPAPAVGAAVRDALPSALSGFTWTCAPGSRSSGCGDGSGTGSIDTTATIAVNDSVTYTVTGTVPSGTTGTLSNTATVTRPNATTDPNCGPTCSSTVDTPGRVTTGLSVTKTPDKNPYVPGQPLTYTIVVKNNGPSDAVGTSVRDTVPATLQNFTWSCTASGGSSCGSTASGTGNINTTVDVLAGSQVTYRLTGTVPADANGALDNRATVTPPSGATDPNCSPDCTSAANPIPPDRKANLVVSKVLLTNPVVPGQPIKWQVKVTNNGPSTARNVQVTDQIPAGVTGPSMVNDQDSSACSIGNGTATCPGVTIPVNGTASWTLTGTLDPNATVTPTNTAVVTGGPDPSASSRTAVASPTVTPAPQAVLSIAKTLLTSPVVPGQQVQWRVTVTNGGPSRARNVVVTDQVPAGVSGASMTADAGGANCPISGGVATCPAVEIPAGSSASWTLSGTLDPDGTTTPTNTAVVTGGPDPSATARTAVATPTSSPTPQANLTVSKALLTSPVVPGQQVQWRVTVTNGGPSRARNVVVTDQVPAGVSGASMTADSGAANCPISGGVATCPAVEIPAGSSASWTLSGSLDPNATVTPTNTVTVTGGPDPSASSHTAVASPTATPAPQAGLTVSKTLVTNPVVPGQQIQWQINVFNAGPSRARNVVVSDQIPAGVSNAVMIGPNRTSCPISGGVATCPAVEIPAGQALNWTLTGTLDSNATVTPGNTVTVTGGPDPSVSTHTAVASPTSSPSPQASLSVSKVLLTNPVVPGEQVQWRVSVTNGGPSRARNVVVTDQVPAGVSGASMKADADGANCPISNGVATCAAVEIAAGQTLSWTLTGTLASDATVTPGNTVTVTGGPDPSVSTHTAVAYPSNSPSPQANLTVSKVLPTNPVVPGEQVQWRVSVTNNGPSRARNVVVTDQVPAGVNDASMRADADGANCPINGGVATCAAVEIAAGQTLSWTLTGTLASDATATPVNTVTVTGGPDPSVSTHTAVASPSNSPSPQANLSVSKVLVTNPVVPGRQIQWQVSVTNNGPSRARNVVVTDQVPAGVGGATMTGADGSNCPIASGVATCPAVEIPAGQTMTWTLSGTLDPNATVTPTNGVTVTGGPDPTASSHTAVASPTGSPTPQAGLGISKALLTSPVVPGQQVQWRVTVTNGGPSRARNVVVTDQVPVGVSGASMTADADGANCPIASGVATCPAVEIPAGSSASWTLSGTLDPDATTTPTNTAVVTGGPDPSATARTAVASPTSSPTPQASLTVSKVLLTDPVVPGRQIQWRVTVMNNGPSRARNVVVTDAVPAGVIDPSMTASDGTACPISGGTATCPAVEIPAGSSATWTLTGTLSSDSTVTPTNAVTVTGGPDPSVSTHTAVASPTSSPSPQASLVVSKVLLTDPVVPGQQVQWRVTVTNNGPSRARNVVVTDQVPAGVNGASMKADADGATCLISNGVATCPAVEIPAGQTLTWTLSGMLDSGATTTPTNTAVVTGGPDPSTTAHTAVASATSSPSPRANLTVSKVLLTNPVVPGQQIQWRVSVTNGGPSRARNVVVTDQVPSGVSGASMTASDGTNCPISNGVATCPAVEIAAGQTMMWTLSGTLDSNATATPGNTVTVTGGPDPSVSTHTAVASPSNSPSPQANLSVSKVLLTNPVVPGEQVQWRVSVTNNGPSRARNVVVTDQVPAGVNDASMRGDADGANCPISNGVATCAAVEIAAGQTLSWTLTGTLASDATVTPGNTVTVTGGPDPSVSTHTAVASPSNSPSPQANLTVSKVLVTNPVVPGQQIQWQVSVTNNGPSRARNVVVSDQVPAGVSNPSMTGSDGSNCSISNGVATCPAVEIPAGQTMTWTLSGTLDPNATVTPTNGVTVTGGPDPTASSHTAVASPTGSPTPQAGLSISKALLTSPVVPGQQVQWRVTVTNSGPSRARNVVVTDQVPASVTSASMTADADGANCPIAGGTATCPAVEIPAGQTLTWTLVGTLDPNATTTPTNTAVVTGGPDPSATARTAVASPTSSPTPQANLTVSKVLLTDPVVPGQQIQWRVTVMNNGPSRARNVVVTDAVPAGVNGPSMTASDGTVCPISGGTATCPAVEIPVGSSAIWTLTGTLAQDATVTPTNTVVVTGGPDPSVSTHTAVASPSNSPSPQANLSVSKVLLTDPVVPGQRVQWRVSVTNGGPSRARNVVVTDQVPAGVNGASMAADADGVICPIGNGVATCPAVEIAAGQTLTWTLSGTLDANATVTPTNTAVVTGGPDPSTPTHTAVASPSNSPSPQANLTVSKSLLTNPVVPGQRVQWRVSVTNNGPSRARNVVVTDQVPAGVNGASMAADADGVICPIGSGVATCPAVEIAAGQTLTWTLSGTLDANATVTPTNTVTVTGGPDPTASSHTAVASPSNSPSPQANLTVSKVLVTDPVVPGQQIQWRVSVTNNGPSRARNVAVTDQVPAGVSNASMTAQDGTGCPIGNGVATCPAVEIAAGQTMSWTLSGTLDPNATVTPTNTVVVTGGPDPSTPTHTAVASPSNSPSPQANLSIAKVLVTNPVVPGQQIQWRVTVTNNGPSRARNVVVTDRVPDGVSGASMTATDGSVCPVANGTAVCPAIELEVGQSVSYTLSGTLMQDATVTPTNTAVVTGGPDPSATAHTAVASSSNSPSPQASLTVAKVLLTNPVVPGEKIQWRVSVTNNGPSRARNVVVSDRIPDGVADAVLQSDADASRCPITNGTAVCPAIELEVGQTDSYTLTGTLDPNATTTPTNTAVVTGGPDPSATAHTAVASPSNSPIPQANLSIAKVLLTNPVVPGQQIQWRVTVTNRGPSRARNVVVTDTIPAMVNAPGMTSDTDGSACPISGGVATCPAVEIPADGTLSYTVTGTLDPAATSTPANVAVVTGGPDPTATAHTATAQASETVVPQARLTVSKVLRTDPVVPGQPIEWRISVTNNGPSQARNVVVSDRIPDGVVGASLSPDATKAACPISGGVATCPGVEIPVGGTATYTLSGTLAQDATTVPGNTAVVTGGPDPSTTAHTAVASPIGSPSPQARLSLAKVLVTDPVVPGGTIQWRVTVTNGGPSRARNVVVTDRVPDGVSGAMMASDEDGTKCPIANGVATCPAIELEVGQAASYTLSGTLAADATVTPTNSVTVTGGPDPTASSHTAVASPSNSPSPQANLSVSKVLLTNPVVPGQQVQWRVTVTNHGPSRARNVVVTDQVPTGVSNASMTAADGSVCPISGGTATCPAVEIPAGSSVTWTLSGTLDANATVTPTNSVTVTGGPDPRASSHTAVASPSNSPSPEANLSVSKVLVTDPVVPGQQIQWRVTVTNNGPSRARNVVVTDAVPAGVNSPSMMASDGTACSISGGTATCPAVEIEVGGSLSWTLTGTLDANATVTPTNSVTVTGGPDPSTPTHTAVASPSNSPSPQASLTVAKVLLTNPVVPGEQVQWRVTVTNNGPSRARNVVVTDQVPAGVSNASMTAADGTVCSISGGTATCPAVEIEVGGSVSWTLTGTLDANATVTPTNSVTVTGGPDPSTPTHTAVASPSNSPSPEANLSVSKVLVTNPVVPGQQIQWRVTVTNNGPSRARNVVVSDQVPVGVSSASMTAADGTACPIANGRATCPAVEIEAGGSVSWMLTGTLDANATVTPTNSVTVTGGPDPSTPTHTAVASPSGTPEPQAHLSVSKVLLTNPVVPGQRVQWRVTVTNNGPSQARNVVVTDQVPAGVSSASMTAADGTACPIANGRATCPAVEIEAGGSMSWMLTGTLDANATVTPTNSVTVTGGPDASTPTHTAVASPSGTPVPQAHLTVSKVLLTNPVVPGQQVQWRVTVTNNGPSRARNVVVTDQVPSGVSNAAMTAADGTVCPISGGTATCPAVEIEAGGSVSWTLTGTLDANATVTPTNSVTVTGGPDPSTPTHTAVASPSGTPEPQAHLTVSKVLLTNPVVPGQRIQWQVSVANDGPSRARNVVVTDRVPAGVLDASMAAQDGAVCPIANGTATCPAVEIPVGGLLTWTLSGMLDPGATVTPTNTALVTGGPDPSTGTHTAVASPSTGPVAEARLSVSKALLTDPVVPGQRVEWQVAVTNRGPSVARDVVVADQVPAGVADPSMTADDGTACPIAGGTATCPGVEIQVGETRTWTLVGTLDAGATV
ncbi:hypothetical protein ACFVXG_02280, partial [Kitasatospora sp. NPDC058162]|uniref:hypothetical protein n=1 Tax=Kitasatospora sp. NPDC058162 TaxID=3346362 RepID=UPI0036D85823